MVQRRPPPKLEDLAFAAWLKALDLGVSLPTKAPPVFLSRALLSGGRLRESTIVKVASAAAASVGIGQLNIEGEFLNPALVKQLAVVLLVHPEKLESLVLDLSPRIEGDSTLKLLVKALGRTVNLQQLRLLGGGANDKLLVSLADACPPLKVLDLSFSEGVTDAGILALLENPLSNGQRPGSSPLAELRQINIWRTKVTTRGCMALLRHCHMLTTITCQWTAEALVLLDMRSSNPVRLEKLFIEDELLDGNLRRTICNMCPCLRSIIIRKPKEGKVDISEVTRGISLLEDLSILQFAPINLLRIDVPELSNLTRLHLAPLTAPVVLLDVISTSCPMLKILILEGISPQLSRSLYRNWPINPETQINHQFPNLDQLRLITPFTSSPLDPVVVNWAVTNTRCLKKLDLGSCSLLTDETLRDIIIRGCMRTVEDLYLSKAIHLSDILIQSLIHECSSLKRIALKMLTRERHSQIEALKMNLRLQNIDVEIITY